MVTIFAIIGGWFYTAWLFMLSVGIAHEQWWSGLPTTGFWTAMVLVAFPYFMSIAVAIVRAILAEAGNQLG